MSRSDISLAPIVLEFLDIVNLEMWDFSEPSRLQVAAIARHTGINCTDEMTRTYCFLREAFFQRDKLDGVCPSQMSDQRLFGEVLLLFNRIDDFSKLKEVFPTAFND